LAGAEAAPALTEKLRVERANQIANFRIDIAGI
jgi:hypothetical protein